MRWRARPSKPQAVFTALVGVAIIVFGITTVHADTAFLVLWCAVGAGIVGMNLWAAFSPRGRLYEFEEDRDRRWRR